jgi:hypothetical protein
MKVYFIDETNTTNNTQMEFVIFGGLVVEPEEIRSASIALLELKQKFGIKKERPIKWPNVNWKGEGILDKNLHAQIKNEILKIVSKSKFRIIVNLTPQFFYHSSKLVGSEIKQVIDIDKQEKEFGYAINLTFENFNQYLKETKDCGFVIADSFAQNLRESMVEHCLSLFPKGTNRSELEKIVYPIIELKNEYSPIHQINDVVLGAISYSLMESGHNFLPILKNNFWCRDPQNKETIIDAGFNIYPSVPRNLGLKISLQKITDKFLTNLNEKKG